MSENTDFDYDYDDLALDEMEELHCNNGSNVEIMADDTLMIDNNIDNNIDIDLEPDTSNHNNRVMTALSDKKDRKGETRDVGGDDSENKDNVDNDEDKTNDVIASNIVASDMGNIKCIDCGGDISNLSNWALARLLIAAILIFIFIIGPLLYIIFKY